LQSVSRSILHDLFGMSLPPFSQAFLECSIVQPGRNKAECYTKRFNLDVSALVIVEQLKEGLTRHKITAIGKGNEPSQYGIPVFSWTFLK